MNIDVGPWATTGVSVEARKNSLPASQFGA